MHTEHVEFLLPEYLDGTIDESLRPGVEEHMKRCRSCASELEDMRLVMGLLNEQQPVVLPAGYFSTVLPRVRERLELPESRTLPGTPLMTRFLLPAAAAAVVLFILFSLPFPTGETEGNHNPLQAVMHGSTNDELVDVVLDMVPLQPLSTPTVEGETSSMLGAKILRGDQLLASADDTAFTPDVTLDERMPEGLEQLNDADLDVLVQRLGERTTL